MILTSLHHGKACPHDPSEPTRALVGLALAGLLAACTSSLASPAELPSADPRSSNAAVDGCGDTELSAPSGEGVNLDGTWVTEREGTRGGIYYFQQVGSCIWFAGGFPPPDDEEGLPLGYLTVVFRGALASDFTIRGSWVDVRDQFRASGQGGTIELRIEFAPETDEVRLVYAGGSGQPFVEPGFREEQSWIQISEGGAYPPQP